MHKLFKAVGIALLAFVLSWFVAYDFTSLSYFAPLEKASDFIASDFYTLVADSRTVKKYDRKITVVSLDNLSREEIAAAFDTIAAASPAVTAIDLIFQERGDDTDILLAEAISSLGKVIRPVALGTEEYEDDSRLSGNSIYDPLDNTEPGFVNLEAASVRSVIREFRPVADSLCSFPAAAVRAFDREAYKKLCARGNVTESINFSSSQFDIISPREAAAHPELIRDRLVFAGVVNDYSDMHATPVNESTPGILIHASAASTILSGNYIDSAPVWMEWIIAGFLSVMLILAQMKLSGTKAGNMLMRWIQVGILVTLILGGTVLFIHKNTTFDLTLPLLMIMLSLLASDIWAFAETVLSKISRLSISIRRKLTILLLLISTSVMASAQRYEVFRTTGDITMLSNGAWKQLGRFTPLKASDKIRIGKKSSVAIKDNNTSDLYYGVLQGEHSVISIITQAKKSAKARTAAVGGIIGDTPQRKGKPVLGAAVRGTETNIIANDSITCDTISSHGLGIALHNILSTPVRADNNDTLPVSLKLHISQPDSILSFIIKSDLNRDLDPYGYFINIIRVTDGEPPALLLSSSNKNELFSISAEGSLIIDWIPSLYNPKAEYYLLLTRSAIAHDTLADILRSCRKQDKQPSRPPFISLQEWNRPTYILKPE